MRRIRWELDGGWAQLARERARDARADARAHAVCAGLEQCGGHEPFRRRMRYEPPLVRVSPCEFCGGKVLAESSWLFTAGVQEGFGQLVAHCDDCDRSFSIWVSQESLDRELKGFEKPPAPPVASGSWDAARERFFAAKKESGSSGRKR